MGAEVRRQAALGVDYIKLYAHLEPELVKAGIDEAKYLGLKTIGHLGRTGWGQAAEMGIDARQVEVYGCGPSRHLLLSEDGAKSGSRISLNIGSSPQKKT